jgi:DNA-binding MarR family transcriptional regulator
MEKLNNHSLFLLSLNRFCYDVGRIISKKYHLTVNERNALIVLSNIEINSVKELSGYLSISKTNTSKVLSSLEKKSLLIRIFDTKDKRFIQLLLTENGKLTSNQVADEINQLLKERISKIPGELGESVKNFIDENQEFINYYSFKTTNQR